MRSRLPNTAQTGAIAIESVKISKNKRSSRDALPQLLFGFQELYSNKPLLDKVLTLLENQILSDKKKTGRPGMCLWQILLLGVVRVGKGLSYAGLLDLVNNHRALRGMMGFGGLDNEFSEQTLNENVQLLTDDLLQSINTLLVEAGNDLLKKTIRKLKTPTKDL